MTEAAPGLITFDCYGTLIDWYGGLGRALGELGVPESERDRICDRYVAIEAEVEGGPYLPYREVMTRALERTLEEHGRSLPPTQRDILAESVPTWEPFPEAPSVLQALGRHAPLAILSNVDDDLLEASVRHLGVSFAHRVTAQAVRSYKPAHPHFLRIQELTGHGAGEILHVAASLMHDQVPCRQLRISSVWINRRNEARPEWLPAARVLPDLRRLPDIALET